MVPLLELVDVTVRFPATLACDRASLSAFAGEIHSVVGENGAGKSTLMHVAAGIQPPTSGQVKLSGEVLRVVSPRAAQLGGVAMVYQSFRLVERLTVLDNVMLGLDGLPQLLPRNRLERQLLELARPLGLEVDPAALVASLAVGQKQKVALLRALFRKAKVLILDEPTAVLTPDEAGRLLETMRRLADQGMALLFVSHKLPEIMTASDRITVMSRGQVVAAGVNARELTAGQVAAMMVGKSGEEGDGRWAV